jgi:cell filamentation protein
MYDAVADDYCYPGTTVLKNKLNLTDADELAAFEAEVSDARADEEAPGGDLDYAHFKAIHRHLFQDVYDWAGEAPEPCVSRKTTVCFVTPRTSTAKRRSYLRN